MRSGSSAIGWGAPQRSGMVPVCSGPVFVLYRCLGGLPAPIVWHGLVFVAKPSPPPISAPLGFFVRSPTDVPPIFDYLYGPWDFDAISQVWPHTPARPSSY